MKAHQNRNMTYDDMNDYVLSMERRNIILTSKLMFMCSYERNVQASIVLSIILAMHRLFPLLEGSQLAQHASPDEAHGAVNSASGCLGHH